LPAIDNPEAAAHFARQLHAIRKQREAVTPAQVKARLLGEFSPKLHFLFDPAPYKVAWSGRYAQKSWSYSAAILQLGMERQLRIVCLRETMKSLEDSVHALMEDQIKRLGLSGHYNVRQSDILSKNGTEIFYAGLKNNVANIKSMEGCDIFWVEEGQGVGKESWETLIPTIRKPGAELWVSMNPRFAEDDSYQRWIVNPPPGAKVVFLSYQDNKYITPDMQSKMDHLFATDPDMFDHVYNGACLSTVQDAIYKDQISNAEKNGQFRNVPYDARKSVDVVFDLGYGDMVSMWFMQTFPFETRFIDYHEDTHQAMDHYLQVMQSKGYTYGECIMPWDAGSRHVSTGKSSADVVKSKGFHVRVLRQGPVHERIDATRTIFPQLYFDAKKCKVGISHLRRYQWGAPGTNGTLKREPLHDQASHAADALGYAVLAVKTPPANKPAVSLPNSRRTMGGSLAGFR
jgi:phage terminase large subunit